MQLIREIKKGWLGHNEGAVSASKRVALACAPSRNFKTILKYYSNWRWQGVRRIFRVYAGPKSFLYNTARFAFEFSGKCSGSGLAR